MANWNYGSFYILNKREHIGSGLSYSTTCKNRMVCEYCSNFCDSIYADLNSFCPKLKEPLQLSKRRLISVQIAVPQWNGQTKGNYRSPHRLKIARTSQMPSNNSSSLSNWMKVISNNEPLHSTFPREIDFCEFLRNTFYWFLDAEEFGQAMDVFASLGHMKPVVREYNS